MGRAAEADVLGGWEGMVPASFHAPAARALSGPSPLSTNFTAFLLLLLVLLKPPRRRTAASFFTLFSCASRV